MRAELLWISTPEKTSVDVNFGPPPAVKNSQLSSKSDIFGSIFTVLRRFGGDYVD